TEQCTGGWQQVITYLEDSRGAKQQIEKEDRNRFMSTRAHQQPADQSHYRKHEQRKDQCIVGEWSQQGQGKQQDCHWWIFFWEHMQGWHWRADVQKAAL